MEWIPSFEKAARPDGGLTYRIGHRLVDEYLEFASAGAGPTRSGPTPTTCWCSSVVGKEPTEVTPRTSWPSSSAQRRPRSGAENVVRISDGGSGLSVSTIKRRLAAVSSSMATCSPEATPV